MYIRDPEAFMDPTGGRGLGQGLTTDTTGLLLGLTAETGLVSKFIIDPELKKHTDKIGIEKQKYKRKLVKDYTSNFEYHVKLGQGVGKNREETLKSLRRGTINSANKFEARITAENRNIKGLRSAKKFFRGFGLATLASFGFEMASSLGKPGITSVAKKKEENMYINPYVDSAEAYTQRQRALQAIVDSQSSMRNVIGNEASHFHR